MTYVLRKSYGAWSAGTQVEHPYEDPFDFFINGVEIPPELVVQRRNMTREVPAINSKERRKRTKAAMRNLSIPNG